MRITASCGVVSYPDMGKEHGRLLRDGDKAVAQAKRETGWRQQATREKSPAVIFPPEYSDKRGTAIYRPPFFFRSSNVSLSGRDGTGLRHPPPFFSQDLQGLSLNIFAGAPRDPERLR